MHEKIILTDCDGVLLDWEFAFHTWMQHRGYTPIEAYKDHYRIEDQYEITNEKKKTVVRQFNESAAIGFLPPFRDAVHYVRKLHEQHGFIFHVITSLSTDKYAGQLRTQNLQKLFGITTFDAFVFLDTGVDKDAALLPYKDTGCYWVEDHIKNVEVGEALGLTGILMEHKHNMRHQGCFIAKTWKDVYQFIIGE